MNIKYILLFSMFTLLLCFTGCKKNTNEDTTTEEYYAKNEVTSATSEEETLTTTEELTELTTEEPISPLEYKFNVIDDINANENLSYDTISIDGKLISFPCDYNHLKSVFNNFYISKFENNGKNQYIDVELNEDDYKDITNIKILYKPTTGYGKVEFTLVSPDDTNTSITNCICNEVTLSGNDISDEQLMTIALYKNIHFGSTVEDIKNAYGKVTNLYNVYDNNSFVIEYISDETGNQYYFSGKSGGLSNINLKYNLNTTINNETNNDRSDYYDDKDEE